MTHEQIKKLRDDLKDRQPWVYDGEIDELCDLALKGLLPEAGRKDGLQEAAAYCRDLSEMSYRAGNPVLGAAQDAMARELERRHEPSPQKESGS